MFLFSLNEASQVYPHTKLDTWACAPLEIGGRPDLLSCSVPAPELENHTQSRSPFEKRLLVMRSKWVFFYQVAAVSRYILVVPLFCKADAHTSPASTLPSGSRANLTTTVPNHKLLNRFQCSLPKLGWKQRSLSSDLEPSVLPFQ